MSARGKGEPERERKKKGGKKRAKEKKKSGNWPKRPQFGHMRGDRTLWGEDRTANFRRSACFVRRGAIATGKVVVDLTGRKGHEGHEEAAQGPGEMAQKRTRAQGKEKEEKKKNTSESRSDGSETMHAASFRPRQCVCQRNERGREASFRNLSAFWRGAKLDTETSKTHMSIFIAVTALARALLIATQTPDERKKSCREQKKFDLRGRT